VAYDDRQTGTGNGQTATTVAPTSGPLPTQYQNTLAESKTARMARLFELLGIGTPGARHSFGGAATANMAGKFEDWKEWTQGLDGGMVNDDIEGLIQKFASYVRGPGGYGKLRDDANAAMNTPGIWDKNDDDLNAQIFQKVQGVANSGRSDLMQTVYGNAYEDALQQFMNRYNTAGRGLAAPPDMRLLAYLQSDPESKRYLGLK